MISYEATVYNNCRQKIIILIYFGVKIVKIVFSAVSTAETIRARNVKLRKTMVVNYILTSTTVLSKALYFRTDCSEKQMSDFAQKETLSLAKNDLSLTSSPGAIYFYTAMQNFKLKVVACDVLQNKIGEYMLSPGVIQVARGTKMPRAICQWSGLDWS